MTNGSFRVYACYKRSSVSPFEYITTHYYDWTEPRWTVCSWTFLASARVWQVEVLHHSVSEEAHERFLKNYRKAVDLESMDFVATVGTVVSGESNIEPKLFSLMKKRQENFGKFLVKKVEILEFLNEEDMEDTTGAPDFMSELEKA